MTIWILPGEVDSVTPVSLSVPLGSHAMRLRQLTPTPSRTPIPTPTTTPTPTPTPEPLQRVWVDVTFYTCPPFCAGDTTASGEPLIEGTAACGYGLELGVRFLLHGEEYACLDRGHWTNPLFWVDIWRPDDMKSNWEWQAEHGTLAEIQIMEEEVRLSN